MGEGFPTNFLPHAPSVGVKKVKEGREAKQTNRWKRVTTRLSAKAKRRSLTWLYPQVDMARPGEEHATGTSGNSSVTCERFFRNGVKNPTSVWPNNNGATKKGAEG